MLTDDEVVVHESDFMYVGGVATVTPPPERGFQPADPSQRRERKSVLEAEWQQQMRRKTGEYERDRRRDYAKEPEGQEQAYGVNLMGFIVKIRQYFIFE